MKIRASYGVTGNNSISNTAAYATLTSSVYGGAAGYYTSSLGNADLGWEKTHSTDIAGNTPHLLLTPKTEPPSKRKLPESI